MTESMKRRVFGVVALVIAAGALGFISMSDMGDDLIYYWSPAELEAKADKALGATVRLGGMVVQDTLNWDQEAQLTEFDITDGTATVHIINAGNPPQMFREGIGVVVEGQLQADGTFQSDKVMVKHSNEYAAPDGSEDPTEAYKSLVVDES